MAPEEWTGFTVLRRVASRRARRDRDSAGDSPGRAGAGLSGMHRGGRRHRLRPGRPRGDRGCALGTLRAPGGWAGLVWFAPWRAPNRVDWMAIRTLLYAGHVRRTPRSQSAHGAATRP